MQIDPNDFYVYAYRGGKDEMEILSIVPESVFRILKEHEDDLDNGRVPREAREALDLFLACPDIMPFYSEDDISQIDPDRFTGVTLT
jgi:hypothetical protein